MTHVDNVTRATSGHVTLTLLALSTVAWLVADLTVMETYTRPLVGVYLFFAGILTASLVGCSSSSSSFSSSSPSSSSPVGADDVGIRVSGNVGASGVGGVGGVAAVNKVIIGVLIVVIVGFVCVKIGCCVEKMRKGRKYSLTHEKITFA